MNDVIQQLYDRKSVRVFTEQPISPQAREQILTAATMAPTAGNQQLYTILDITDPKIKYALVDTCDHQSFIAQGKLLLVFCADCLKWYRAYQSVDCNPRKPGVGDLFLALNDALIAAQNAVVAAESLGIGSCYIGDIMENCQAQRKLLGLPDYVFPAALLVFGYPTEQQKTRKKPVRAPLDTIVSENRYPEMDQAYLQRMLGAGREGADFAAWLTAFCNRKYNCAFSREMTRSVGEFLEQYQEVSPGKDAGTR